MIETLVGTLFGGLFRMLPEFLKWLDRKDERAHELSMFDKQLEADKIQIEAGQKLAEIEANKSLRLGDLQALIEGVKAQAVQTGVRWVDAINSLMRPLITFWWVIALYTSAMIAQFVVLVQGGMVPVEAVLRMWGPDEKAIVASIISFWFVDRSLKYNGLK
jgi:hypothetical protein